MLDSGGENLCVSDELIQGPKHKEGRKFCCIAQQERETGQYQC
jgi:hypothetical protein